MPLDKNSFRTKTFDFDAKPDTISKAEGVAKIYFDFCKLVDYINAKEGFYSYTIGAPGVTTAPDGTAVNYNFVSAANTNEQSIQLGATTIVPAKCYVEKVVAYCLSGAGATNISFDVGKTAGSDEWLSGVDIDDTDEITSAGEIIPNIAASSVYFSGTPDANWSGVTTGCWKVDIYIKIRP